jgi:hypothetical protein
MDSKILCFLFHSRCQSRLNNLNRIKIQKDGKETITFRFHDRHSAADIDCPLRNTSKAKLSDRIRQSDLSTWAASIPNNLKYSISYKDTDTNEDIHIVTNANMLREYLKENINQLDVFVVSPTPASCKLELQNV